MTPLSYPNHFRPNTLVLSKSNPKRTKLSVESSTISFSVVREPYAGMSAVAKKDYVIKDSWTHESHLNREADILTKIRGLKGVPQLVAAWTVQAGGSDDWTDLHRLSLPSFSDVRVHRRLLMELVGTPLSEFKTIRELLSILIDILDSA